MQPDQVYQLLRSLTSPVVAITSERGGKRNGMISDSAVRASIVPAVPRLSVYVHKFNFSHDLIFETGRVAQGIRGAARRRSARRRAAVARHQSGDLAGARGVAGYGCGAVSPSSGSSGECSYTIGGEQVQGSGRVSATCALTRGGRYLTFAPLGMTPPQKWQCIAVMVQPPVVTKAVVVKRGEMRQRRPPW